MAEPPIPFTTAEVTTYYSTRVPALKQTGVEWRGPCPIHRGWDNNFAVSPETGHWFCFSRCGRGGDILDLETALSGGNFPAVKAKVFRLVGRIEPGHGGNGTRTNRNSAGTVSKKPTKPTVAASRWREIERYPYVEREGTLLFEVIRYLKPDGTKTFTPVRPSGVETAGTDALPVGAIVVGLNAGNYASDSKAARNYGKTAWKHANAHDPTPAGAVHLRECPRVPYRLPRLLTADTVYLPEGEKDVHTLEGWGLAASCNPGGAGRSHLFAGWKDYFRGRHIVILPDNDGPGRKHAAAVAAALLAVAGSIRIVELPGLPEKGDVTDWRDTGGTLETFRKLTDAETVAPLDAAALLDLRARWGIIADHPGDEPVSRHETAAKGSLTTRCLSDIEAKPIRWLWKGRIARGRLTIIAGNPGLGKSQITASIAAVVTQGGRWPVDRDECEPGSVLFLSAEDDPADTLRPRLEAAGAELARVHVIDGAVRGYRGDGSRKSGTFSLEHDLQALGAKLAELGSVAVVVIDPITAYLGDTDSHKNADVRGLLAPLSELAARYNVAIIGVSHLSKAAGAQVLMRVSGSLAFVAAARAAYVVTSDPSDRTRRLFLPMKNNLGPDATGLAFRIDGATVASPAGPLETSRVAWDTEAVPITADEAIQAETTRRRTSAVDDAADWLCDTLADGPMPASEISELATVEGISKKTLRRAREELGIKPAKLGMKSGWTWSLPPKMPKTAKDDHQNNLGTFRNVRHLLEPHEVEVEL